MKHLRLDSGALWEASDEKALAFGNHNFEWRILPWSLGLIQGSLFQSLMFPLDCLSLFLHLPYTKEDRHFPSLGQSWAPPSGFQSFITNPLSVLTNFSQEFLPSTLQETPISPAHINQCSLLPIYIYMFLTDLMFTKQGLHPLLLVWHFFFPTANCTSRSSLQTCSRSPMPCPSPQHSQSGIGFLQSLPI